MAGEASYEDQIAYMKWLFGDKYGDGGFANGVGVPQGAQQLPSASASAGQAAAATDPAAQATFAGEEEFVLGGDGVGIYQRVRDGFRTVSWKLVGTMANIAAAAQAAGTEPQVLASEMRKQQQTVATANWQYGPSGKTNPDGTPMSNADLQRYNQQQGGLLTASDNAWKMAASPVDGKSWQQYEQDLQGNKDLYSTGETAYDLAHQQDTHNLQDMQRTYQTGETGFNLAHQAQTQQQNAIKLNQSGYEQQQAMKSRDLAGYGYAAMNSGAGTKLAGT